jgi:serine phosphatase RsbU (regulator of sigma subunit)
VKKNFQLLISLSITLLVAISFALVAWLFSQNLYRILVEQALEDNQVIGESVLELLQKVHNDDKNLEHIIPSVQNTCDLLKLPNGGYVCATTSDGALVAAPGFTTAHNGKTNLNKARFSNLDRTSEKKFNDLVTDSVFRGFYEYPASGYSDIIVKVKHKSGLHILVHQDNRQITQKAQEEGNRLLFIGIGLSVFIGLLIYFFVNKQILSYQETISKQNLNITTAYQKIEAQHERIIASINYAQRIQQAILPATEDISIVFPRHFVLLKPKNIVSGDFYYFQEKNDLSFLAVADCTGHGVPGALMTMLGHEILNEIIQTKGITSPDLILNELHLQVRKSLKQKERQNNDGMDISIVVIDRANQELRFAGAKNSLVYLQGNQFFVLKGDREPIGGKQLEMQRIFTKQIVPIHPESPMTLYLFSDGIIDQFGGGEKKKFGSQRLRELLLKLAEMPMPEQKKWLDETIEQWRGESNEKQTDDILVLGVRL